MVMKTFSLKSSSNKIPFQSIKSFGKIKFEHKSILNIRIKTKRMNNFLSNDDIIGNPSTRNKSMLRLTDKIRKFTFYSVGNRFSNNFVGNIAKTDGSEIFLGIKTILVLFSSARMLPVW